MKTQKGLKETRTFSEERCKYLMERLGRPDSRSLKETLYQVANEVEQKTRLDIELHYAKVNEMVKSKTRCTAPTKSSGTGFFNSVIGQCGRIARISIGKQPFCIQHAGSTALKILIEKQKSKEA